MAVRLHTGHKLAVIRPAVLTVVLGRCSAVGMVGLHRKNNNSSLHTVHMRVASLKGGGEGSHLRVLRWWRLQHW